jgi:signal transduction histidine kinase/CheY-like chemotaxis protein/PAS domain-containing protein
MEAFLTVSQKELHKRVLTQFEFKKSKVTRLALAIYLFCFLATEIPLLLVNHDPATDLPVYLYALRMAFVFIALMVIIISSEDPKPYRKYEDIAKVLIFTGILFCTSFNFAYSREERSEFYGIAPFWEGLDVAFYLMIISLFTIRKWWYRGIFLAMNFIVMVIAKNENNWDLLYIIKLFGILTAILLLMYSLEKDFKVLYLRKLHYKQEEQAWRTLVDALPEGVLVLDTTKDIMYYNRGISEFIPKSEAGDPTSVKAQLHKLMQETHQLKFLSHLQNPNGELTMPPGSGSGTKDKNLQNDTLALVLQTKNSQYKAKKMMSNEEREETTYNYTLWNQIYFFLENYQDCKSKNIGWDSAKGESSFLTFEGRYKERVLEIKIGFSPFDYQDCVIIVLRDMSDRNTIALLEANDKYKSLVLAQVSHELRTPLNNTFNMVTFASEAEETPDEIKTQFLQPALVSVKMLLGLVNDILDYSQINANKFRLVYQDIDIKKLLEETCGLMQLQATKKGIKLFTEIADHLPNPFHTDANRLTQIMLNLLSNSLKFTIKGYIKIKAIVKDLNEGLLEVAVEDTGIGMSTEDQTKLFQDFTKINVEQNAKLNASGCGLGLSISNKLAKALARGEIDPIEVSSELGIGTKFSFKVQNKAHEFRDKSRVTSKERLNSPKITTDNAISHKATEIPSENFIHLQVDETTKRKDHHALDKSIVEYYRTSLDVSNSLINPSSVSTVTKRKKSNFDKPEIMVVDDDAFNVLSLETILKSLRYPFCHAYNGKEAVEKLLQRNAQRDNENVKLVFMDCNMPILDGFGASKELREKMNKGMLVEVIIVGCTGYEGQEHRQICLDNGMDDVITKPVSKAKVDEILKKHLSL